MVQKQPPSDTRGLQYSLPVKISSRQKLYKDWALAPSKGLEWSKLPSIPLKVEESHSEPAKIMIGVECAYQQRLGCFINNKQISKYMQPPQKIQGKNISRKLYSSPSAVNITNKSKASTEFNLISKPARIRRTDHTEDKYSEASNSQIHQNNGQGYGHVAEEGLDENEVRDSRMNIRVNLDNPHLNVNGLQYLSQKQQNVIELRERLKNIHHFYRIRIEEERSKNIERNEIFISLIQQLQKTHNDKILTLQRTLEELENDKQQIGVVDERMGSIKSTIEEILKQSEELKESNDKKQKEILKKQISNKQKEVNCISMKEELDTMREKLEQFQRLKLKENKRSKELLEMIRYAATPSFGSEQEN